MEIAFIVVGLVATVVVVAPLADRIGLPAPLALLIVGLGASLVPFVPEVQLSPEVVLYGLLPPLLYAAAQGTSIADIKNYRTAILGLSVGLVLFTAFGVAAVATWILPIPFAIALALGAIVSPPDAVAATSIARRIGLPRSITTILEGESLFNDATALVTLRTAVAVAGFAATAHVEEVTGWRVALDFGWAVVGGIAIGIAVAFVVGLIRRQLTSSAADTALSWLVPFLAYVPAEEVHASGVFAVVTAGLLLAHKAPMVQTAASRMSERTNWRSITFVMENLVFLLIGLQLTTILADVQEDTLSMGQTVISGLIVLAAVILLRPLWIFPFTWIVLRGRWSRQLAAASMVASWAGMRGVVTLAAAFTLPEAVPHRPALIMIALIVTVGTLLIEGLTLPGLARLLDVRGPDPREDALQTATVVQATTGAGLRRIETDESVDTTTIELLRTQSMARVNRVWEQITNLNASTAETPSEAYRRARLEMIGAERDELMEIRSEGDVDEPIITRVLTYLDAEETSLRFSSAGATAIREAPLAAPDQVRGSCEHLEAEPLAHTPNTPEGCEECLAMGRTDWVALRLCTRCGHVGCCDSSLGHATAHFHAEDHPVMRSAEPGELWRWCYVDEVLG